MKRELAFLGLCLLLMQANAQLVSSSLCDAQNLCTCWNNATAAQLPACYNPAIYQCANGISLQGGSEATCAIRKGSSSSSNNSPAPMSLKPSPSPSPKPSSGLSSVQQLAPSPLCDAQALCTCWTNASASEPPACYNKAIYKCVNGISLQAGSEITCFVSYPSSPTPVASPSPSPSSVLVPSPSPKASPSPVASPSPLLKPSPLPSPAPPASPSPVQPQLAPSPLCDAQGLCTCWNNISASQPPACYNRTIYKCVNGVNLQPGSETTCSVSRPSSSPSPASWSPSPRPSASPSPIPRSSPSPRPSPSPLPVPSPSPVARSPSPRPPSPSPTPVVPSPSPRPPSPSPNPVVPSPSPRPPSPSPVAPSPSPVPPKPSPPPVSSPSPSPGQQLVPSQVCEAQNLCTCWNNATAAQPPACYSPTIYKCVGGISLQQGSEATCTVPRGGGSSSPAPAPQPSPPPPAPQPSTPPGVVPSPLPPSPPPPRPPPPSNGSINSCGVPLSSLGALVAPVAGTLTADGLPATATSLTPFNRADNTKTTPLIRMPAASKDPNGLLARPTPTNAWWTNIMWGGPVDNPSYGEDPVQIFPYHLRVRGPPHPTTTVTDRGVWFCKPFYTGDNDGGVIMATWPELQLTLKEIQASSAPSITALDWDDLSLTLEYNAASSSTNNSPSLRMPLVKGSPYLTAEVPTAAQPVIRAPGGDGGGVISSVSQPAANKLKLVIGSVPSEGTHTFGLWASKPISYGLSGGSLSIWEANGPASGTFSGTIRLAWMPNAGTQGAAAIESMLDTYVDAIPVGGTVNAFANLAAGTASYSLAWSTKSMSSGSSTPTSELLMLALPHHIDTLAAPSAAPASGVAAFPLGVGAAGAGATETKGVTAYTSQPPKGSSSSSYDYGAYIMTVRGPQVPIIGSCWLLQEQLVPLGSESEEAANLKNPAWRANIEKTLLADLPLVLPPSTLPANSPFADWPGGPRAWPWKGMMNVDSYFGGSEMQAMARLISIAKALSDTAAASGSSFGPLAASAAANVTNALGLLLQKKLTLPCIPTGTDPGALCYDGVFKLVTTARALADANDGGEFFSRTGTDHHFHYGYWVGAAAAVAAQDLAWYKGNLQAYVKALVRDFANNDKSDPVLPFARHKDWYMGHSWAAGLQLSYDGKNQESSSEAVNAYYGVSQLGKATGDPVLEGWGRLLLANEITAARKYTQVYAGNDIYSKITGSSSNGITQWKVATILFAAKASAYNWFDPDVLTRHAIQWMPFSPISNELLPQGWMQEAVPLVAAGTKMPTDRYWSPSDGSGGGILGWRVLLTMAQSMVPGQQAAAWEALAALPVDASDGFALCGTMGRLTRTAAKWWIATRP